MATGSGSASSRPGWMVDWTRPGEMTENHLWKLPVYDTREAPRRFLGITFGTRREKYVERYEDKVEVRGTFVAGHRSAVTALAFTGDGRLLASGSRDGSLRVWYVQSGREACAHLETRSAVLSMALVPDRSMLAAVLADRRLVLWDFGLRRQVIHLEAPDRSPLQAVAVSSDGRWVAAGGSRRSIYVWQTDGASAEREIENATGRIETLAFTPDASGIVCGTHKGRIELFERDSGAQRWSVRTGLGRFVALAAPTRANGVVCGAIEGTVACWDVATGSEMKRVRPMPGRLASLAVAADASHLLVGYASGQAFLTEAGTDRQVAVLEGHPGAVTASALPAAGKCAATGASDGTVRLWVPS
ncbi:MAG TPA: hypothetical protein VI504_14005 [Candidatus Eisenbacteria bacterium]